MANQSSFIQNFFRKITGKHRDSYEINSIQFKYSDFGFYKEFCFKENKQLQVETLESIVSNVKLKTSPKDLKKALGKPVLIVDISTKPKLKIYLYKIIRKGAKQKLYFHFFEDKLVIMSRLFAFASNEQILKLHNKYFEQHNLPKRTDIKSEISFLDNDNQSLFLVKNIEYTEHLINPDASFKDFISTKFD